MERTCTGDLALLAFWCMVYQLYDVNPRGRRLGSSDGDEIYAHVWSATQSKAAVGELQPQFEHL